ncbi:hypothetical protein [Streptomyces sp. NPDC051636]|uniref:hypothetical protein n=1 Tax=Streptomyces sp. NPDC051636 TaxID=3365663 RepID=UPI003790A836
MSDHTPSQAEGEPEEPGARTTADDPGPEHPPPSQAEGDRDDVPDTAEETPGGTGS